MRAEPQPGRAAQVIGRVHVPAQPRYAVQGELGGAARGVPRPGGQAERGLEGGPGRRRVQGRAVARPRRPRTRSARPRRRAGPGRARPGAARAGRRTARPCRSRGQRAAAYPAPCRSAALSPARGSSGMTSAPSAASATAATWSSVMTITRAAAPEPSRTDPSTAVTVSLARASANSARRGPVSSASLDLAWSSTLTGISTDQVIGTSSVISLILPRHRTARTWRLTP